MHMVPGSMVVVVYSKPMGVWSYKTKFNTGGFDLGNLLRDDTDLGPLCGGCDGRKGLAGDYQGDFMDERLDVSGVGGVGAELADLGLEAGMTGDVNVGGEGGHDGHSRG